MNLFLIGGFELPTSGRIELRGRDVTLETPERRPVNMVFQSYALFPHLSVIDNVAFGLRRRQVPDNEAPSAHARPAGLYAPVAVVLMSAAPVDPMPMLRAPRAYSRKLPP